MRVIVYGQAPSRTSDPTRPLSGRSGDHLARLAGLESAAQLAVYFDLRNLIDRWPGSAGEKGDAFPRRLAQERAESEIRGFQRDDRVLLLGREVAAAFGLSAVPCLTETALGDGRATVLPHPSGANLAYNEPSTRERVSLLLRRLLTEVERQAPHVPA